MVGAWVDHGLEGDGDQVASPEETEIPPVRKPMWEPFSHPIERRDHPPVDEEVFNTPDPVWMGMPRSTFRRVGLYLRFAADKVGLRDWAFNLRWDYYTENDEATAAVKVIRGQKRATMWLCKEFADLPEPEQRHALLHELMHCHFDALDEVIWTVAGALGQNAHGILHSAHHNALEVAVDAIASEWATMMPSIAEFDQEDS